VPSAVETPRQGSERGAGDACNPLASEALLPPAEEFPATREIADRVGSIDCRQTACWRAPSESEPRAFSKAGFPLSRNRMLKETDK